MDCSLPGSSVHGDSPGKNTGVGCHALLTLWVGNFYFKKYWYPLVVKNWKLKKKKTEIDIHTEINKQCTEDFRTVRRLCVIT